MVVSTGNTGIAIASTTGFNTRAAHIPAIPGTNQLSDTDGNAHGYSVAIDIQFIRDDPGSTLYDISKSLETNLGTVRYQLMILDINHLVATYHDGAKRIRYFTNNGSYSRDQMKIVSLLKREPTSKLLGAPIGKTGMSNAQITVESGLPYSDVNRYLKELMAKSIVVRESLGNEKYLYRIAPSLEDQIASNIRP